MRWQSPFVLAVIFASLGCGGTTSDSGSGGGAGSGASGGRGGSGGQSGSGGQGGKGGSGGQGGVGGQGASTGTGGGGGVPPECSVSSSSAPPFNVRFRFENTSAAAVWLRESCALDYAITACADDYQTPLVTSGTCTVDCAEPDMGCIACGACFEGGRLVAPASMIEAEWAGRTYTFDTLPTGCSCHHTTIASGAKYRITVPIFASEEAAQARIPTRNVAVDFDLDSASVEVVVPIGG